MHITRKRPLEIYVGQNESNSPRFKRQKIDEHIQNDFDLLGALENKPTTPDFLSKGVRTEAWSKEKNDIVKKFSSDIKVSIFNLLRNKVHECRRGKVYVKLLPLDLYVEVFILGDNRSYQKSKTMGACKLIKIDNYYFKFPASSVDFNLKELDLNKFFDTLLSSGKLKIKQFVSVSRPLTAGLQNPDKEFLRKNPRVYDNCLKKEGYVELKILDSHCQQKNIYITEFLGKTIEKSIVDKDLILSNKKDVIDICYKLMESIFIQNNEAPVFDVKIQNILYNSEGEFVVIDHRSPNITFSYTLKGIDYKKPKNLPNKNEIINAQERLLFHNVTTTILRMVVISNAYLGRETFSFENIQSSLLSNETLALLPIENPRLKEDFISFLKKNEETTKRYFAYHETRRLKRLTSKRYA